MSHDAWLRRVEAKAGARSARICPDCGGLNIAQATIAYHVVERGLVGRTSREEGERVLAALEDGPETCDRCGGRTLAAALRELDATTQER